MLKVTKPVAVKEFKEVYADELARLGKDRIAKNELFWEWVDRLCKLDCITSSQYNRWSSPFK